MKRDKKAVVVKYDSSKRAPEVIGKGVGHVGYKLIEKGNDNNIPIYKDEKLVEELLKVDVGDNIPEELYEIVAQVLVFINDLDEGYKSEQ